MVKGQKSWKNLKRIALKRKREIEQEVRKQWLQEQETSHGYRDDDDELDVEAHDDNEGASDLLSQTTVTGPDDASVVTNKKTCKCGSTDHSHIMTVLLM